MEKMKTFEYLYYCTIVFIVSTISKSPFEITHQNDSTSDEISQRSSYKVPNLRSSNKVTAMCV